MHTNHWTEGAIRRGRGGAPNIGTGLASGSRRPTCSPGRSSPTVNTLMQCLSQRLHLLPWGLGRSCCSGPEKQKARGVLRPRGEPESQPRPAGPGPEGPPEPRRAPLGETGPEGSSDLARRQGLGGLTGSRASVSPADPLPPSPPHTNALFLVLFGPRGSGVLGTWQERWLY